MSVQVDKERDAARCESLSKLDLDTSQGLFQALCLLGKIRLRPERIRQDEICYERRRLVEERYHFANPVPLPFRKVRISDLSYTSIEWQMLTLVRSKVPGDEVIFSRYIDLARQRLKTIASELIERNYRMSDAFFRSWRLNDRWSMYEDDSSDEDALDDSETHKDSIYRVPLVPYDHDAYIREPLVKRDAVVFGFDSLNVNRIVQRLEKLRTMNPFHYKPPRDPKPKARKTIVRKKMVNEDGNVVIDLQRCSSFEEDLASQSSTDKEDLGLTHLIGESSKGITKKRLDEEKKRRLVRKKRRHLWCVACAASQRLAIDNTPLKN